MQQEGGTGSRDRTPAKRRFSLLLQDLESQLNLLSASLVEPPQTRTPYREETFTSIDTIKHWAIRSPLDEYHEEPQERCFECNEKLDSLCQIYRGKALCSQCFLTTPKIAVCCACHHTIEGRVVLALGKVWHPHHLKCSECGEILSGGGHFYQRNGEPLCFHHFRGPKQEVCHKCRKLLPECLVEFVNKLYCLKHFTCEFCDKPLQPGSRFFTVDLRPICSTCYRRLPSDLQCSLRKWRRRERYPVNLWVRDFLDRLLCIYPRSRYEQKRIPLNRDALPYLRCGQIVSEPSKDVKP